MTDIIIRLRECAIISPMTAHQAANEIQQLRDILAARALGADKLIQEAQAEIERLRQRIIELEDDCA
jgi:polyhydroxyalkanoate synthesis regulator phasin